MQRVTLGNPLGTAFLGFFVFFVLGWSYYMAATILMRGSIFTGLRLRIERRASDGSWFFGQLRDMLGCVMCTATEAAIWTLGVSTFALGLHCRFVSCIVGITAERNAALPWFAEAILMAGVSFALSLAVSGEAWAIKTVVEHREEKFLALREEFRAREIELLGRITELEGSGKDERNFQFDLS